MILIQYVTYRFPKCHNHDWGYVVNLAYGDFSLEMLEESGLCFISKEREREGNNMNLSLS